MLSCLKPRHLLWALPVVVVALLVACGGSPSAPTAPPPSSDPAASAAAPAGSVPGGSGTLAVKITDSPFSEATALVITFSDISAHTSEGGWVSLPFDTGTTKMMCDLKHLEDAQDMLGIGQLTAGHYTQLRLTVESATIYFNSTAVGAETSPCSPDMTVALLPGNTEEELGTPVDVPSGIVKLVRQFEVTADKTTSILLDFDGDKSVHQTGNGKYKLQPVIKVLSVQ